MADMGIYFILTEFKMYHQNHGGGGFYFYCDSNL